MQLSKIISLPGNPVTDNVDIYSCEYCYILSFSKPPKLTKKVFNIGDSKLFPNDDIVKIGEGGCAAFPEFHLKSGYARYIGLWKGEWVLFKYYQNGNYINTFLSDQSYQYIGFSWIPGNNEFSYTSIGGAGRFIKLTSLVKANTLFF